MDRYVVEELSRVLAEVKSGKVESVFVVTTRKDEPSHVSDHIAATSSGDFFNLIGNVEKHKTELLLKVIAAEGQGQ